jgi:hypothetical protein
MTRVIAWIGVGVAGAALLVAAQERSADEAPGGLAGLAWLAGTWKMEAEDAVLEEVWSLPRGDSLFGAFRWTHKGKARFYELIVIEKGEDGVFLRLRDFGPRLVPWKSEAAGPTTWRLKKTGPREAIFEAAKSRVVYRREADAELVVRIESIPADEQNPAQVFRFRRAGA